MGKADHIKVFRGFYWHHGIDSGDGTVIHYTGEVARKRDAAVKETPFEEFAKGSRVDRVTYERSLSDREVLKRARSRIGEDSYNLAFNNCEHFCSWCKTGEHHSSQVNYVGGGVGLAGGASVLVKSSGQAAQGASASSPAGIALGIANLGTGLFTAYQTTALRRELQLGLNSIGSALRFQEKVLRQLIEASKRQNRRLDLIVHQLFRVRDEIQSAVKARRQDKFRLVTEAVLTAQENLLRELEHDEQAGQRPIDELFRRVDELRNYSKSRLKDPDLPTLARQPLVVALVQACVGRADAYLFEDGRNASAKAQEILLKCAKTIREEARILHKDVTPYEVYSSVQYQVEIYANLYRSLYLSHESIGSGNYEPITDNLSLWELELGGGLDMQPVEALELKTVSDYLWLCKAFEVDPEELKIAAVERLPPFVIQERLGARSEIQVKPEDVKRILLPDTWEEYRNRVAHEFGLEPEVRLKNTGLEAAIKGQHISGLLSDKLPLDPHEGEYHIVVELKNRSIEFRAVYDGQVVTFENETPRTRPPRRTARVAPGRIWFELEDEEDRFRIEWTSDGTRVQMNDKAVDATVRVVQLVGSMEA